MQFPRLIIISAFMSINKIYRVINRRITSSILISTRLFKLLHFIEYEEKWQKDSWLFSKQGSTNKSTTNPVGKILDGLAIVFEATVFKAAFCSPFNSKSANFSEVKSMSTAICQHWRTLFASLSSPQDWFLSIRRYVSKHYACVTGCPWLTNIR